MRGVLSLIAALAIAVASPALAGQPVSLKSNLADQDGLVTLGDLFDGAGAASRTTVATHTGPSVVLEAAAVQLAARRAGLDWTNPDGLHKIIVQRALSVASATPAASHGNVEVLTYTRSLGTGEIVQPTDLAWIKTAAAPTDAPNDADLVIGQAAKRPLRAGAVVLARDFGSAQVVKSGDIVNVTFEAEGISLTLQGKAMGAAGVGDVLSVQNTLSKKVVQTLVTGPGQAVVGPAADQIKSARALRYAVR